MPSATQSCEIWQTGKNGPEHVTVNYVTSLEVECPSFGFLAVPNHDTTASATRLQSNQGDMEFHPQPWSLPVPDAGVDLR